MPDVCPLEPHSVHVYLRHFSNLLQAEFLGIVLIGEFFARDFAQVFDEVNNGVCVELLTRLEDVVDLGGADLLSDDLRISHQNLSVSVQGLVSSHWINSALEQLGVCHFS